ncbi:MAG: diacylglycerol kinase family protein [Chloroflexota bacterium]
MNDFLRTRVLAFRYAFAGWAHVVRTQRNAWVHAAASVTVLLVAAPLGLTRQEWAILLLTITIVWLAEFLNTAIEAVVDLASPQYHELARISKDVGAAAVLISALGAVLIGLLLLGPPLWRSLQALLFP